MNNYEFPRHSSLAIAVFAAAAFTIGEQPELQQRVAEIREAMAANKQALSQYTWRQEQLTSLKGELRNDKVYQVQMGPDGKQQRTLVSSNPPQEAPEGGRLKRKVVEKKKEEYQQYAEQVKALSQMYEPLSPEKLREAVQQGNVTLAPAGAPGEVRLTITNYAKPNDSIQMVFDRSQKAIKSFTVASYLEKPSDVVTINTQFSKLPDGTNHVSQMTVLGESKQLSVTTQNSDYRKV